VAIITVKQLYLTIKKLKYIFFLLIVGASVIVPVPRDPAVQVGRLGEQAGRVLPVRPRVDSRNFSQQAKMFSENILQVRLDFQLPF
jgi:hypothetical protein